AKARKVPQQRAKRQPPGELKTTQKVDVAQEKDKDVKETDANMEEMWTVLKRVQEADMLELCTNHTSFSQTVENVFALSFLVRDGRVKLLFSEQEALRVKALGPSTLGHKDSTAAPATSKEATEGERVQAILSFDMADWRWWRQFVRPEDCLMKARKEGLHAASPAASPEVGSGRENTEPNTARAATGNRGNKSGRKGSGHDHTAVHDSESDMDEEPSQARGAHAKRRRR
ncbi:hypothetical protein WJX84_008076, partial [Apatococcus fuscideae]